MACVIGGESDPCNSKTGWATASDGKGPYDTARMSAISVGAMASIRVRAPSGSTSHGVPLQALTNAATSACSTLARSQPSRSTSSGIQAVTIGSYNVSVSNHAPPSSPTSPPIECPNSMRRSAG